MPAKFATIPLVPTLCLEHTVLCEMGDARLPAFSENLLCVLHCSRVALLKFNLVTQICSFNHPIKKHLEATKCLLCF